MNTKVEGEPEFLRVEEAARQLRISRNSAYSAARNGDIPTLRIGKLLRVPARWLREQRG